MGNQKKKNEIDKGLLEKWTKKTLPRIDYPL